MRVFALGLLLALSLLTVSPALRVAAGLTFTSEGEFTFDVPNGWNVRPFASDDLGEPDLAALVQTPDKAQEINVYDETLGSGQQTALDYLRATFQSAAANPDKHDFQVQVSPRATAVRNADSGAYGVYAYTDGDGVRQLTIRLVGVRGTDVYELNVLPTQSYAEQHADELQTVLDSFTLEP